jgi:hypothetical protein
VYNFAQVFGQSTLNFLRQCAGDYHGHMAVPTGQASQGAESVRFGETEEAGGLGTID